MFLKDDGSGSAKKLFATVFPDKLLSVGPGDESHLQIELPLPGEAIAMRIVAGCPLSKAYTAGLLSLKAPGTSETIEYKILVHPLPFMLSLSSHQQDAGVPGWLVKAQLRLPKPTV